MEELKPCAHCGHSVEWVPTFKIEDDEGEFGYIGCLGCGIQTTKTLTEEEAADIWNARHESDELPEWIKEKIQEHIDCAGPFFNELQKGYDMALNWVLSLRKEENK